MEWYEALILGIVQGLTEFLPVSSSGHLELGNVLLDTNLEQNLSFTILVHAATVLSTLVVFRKDIWLLLKGLLKFRWNHETRYLFFILVSMLPVGLTGLFFKEEVESLFSGNILLVGLMLLVTALLLILSIWIKSKAGNINAGRSLIIGLAQALAVIPGISRSGATISAGLMTGISREEATRFSFLMVLLPVIGISILDVFQQNDFWQGSGGLSVMIPGFLGAFLAGLFACSWMIQLVKKGRLVYFAIYCMMVGGTAILISFI